MAKKNKKTEMTLPSEAEIPDTKIQPVEFAYSYAALYNTLTLSESFKKLNRVVVSFVEKKSFSHSELEVLQRAREVSGLLTKIPSMVAYLRDAADASNVREGTEDDVQRNSQALRVNLPIYMGNVYRDLNILYAEFFPDEKDKHPFHIEKDFAISKLDARSTYRLEVFNPEMKLVWQ